MNRTCYRYFAGAMGSQEKWLNKMAAAGWQLVRTGRLAYEWTSCTPGQFQYKVEYIGNRSFQNMESYTRFLQTCGYRTFYKNINLNWSAGKVVARPWAEPGGRIASSAGAYNRELLIVEKPNDGRPFELHTTFADRADYYRQLRRPWAFALLMTAAAAIVQRSALWAAVSVPLAAALAGLQVQIGRLRQQGETGEQ